MIPSLSTPEIEATYDPSAESPTIAAPGIDQVGSLARRGIAWSGVLTIGRQLLGIGSTIILARVLLPEDYGVMGMVGTLLALVSAVGNFGLSTVTVQRPGLTKQQVDNLFWLGTLIGSILCLITIAAAPLLAHFYNEPKVAPVTMVMAGNFVLGGLSVQPLALLQRRMDFRSATLIELLATVIAVVATVGFALLDWGYWALAAQGIVGQACVLALGFARSHYRPSRPRPDPALRSMVSFGSTIMLSGLFTYFGRNTDTILIGRDWGTEALGFYSRAYFLMTLPMMLLTGSLANVMIPSLSALSVEPERMAEAYRKTLQAIAYIGFPVAIGLAVTASEAIYLVYGPKWGAVVPIFSWLSIAMVCQVITSTGGWILMAQGRGSLMLLTSVISTVTLVAAIAIGNRFGPEGVAQAYAIANLCLSLPIMYLVHRLGGVPFTKSMVAIFPMLLIALAMGVVSWASGQMAEWAEWPWRGILLTKVGVGLMAYAALSLLFLESIPVPQLANIIARRKGMFRYRAAGRRR